MLLTCIPNSFSLFSILIGDLVPQTSRSSLELNVFSVSYSSGNLSLCNFVQAVIWFISGFQNFPPIIFNWSNLWEILFVKSGFTVFKHFVVSYRTDVEYGKLIFLLLRRRFLQFVYYKCFWVSSFSFSYLSCNLDWVIFAVTSSLIINCSLICF